MRLDEYLNLVGVPAYRWADQHGIDRDSVYKILNGRAHELRLKTVVTILNATRGAVSAQELLLPCPQNLIRGRRRKNQPQS